MLQGEPDADSKADAICAYLSSHAKFKSHARAIKIRDLLPLGVKVVDLTTQPNLALAVDELYCCVDILFSNSPAYKIFENGKGDALVRQQQQFFLPGPIAPKKP